MITIKEGAVFIADAHYPHHGDELIKVLKDIKQNKIKTTQLFLMGDIFDILFDNHKVLLKYNHQAINLINDLSLDIEIHYIEGNHDFLLQNIFPKVKVYPYKQQPIKASLLNKSISLAHGDNYDTGFLYQIYTHLIRNRYILKSIYIFDTFLLKYFFDKLPQKHICNKFINFENKVQKILSNYQADIIIEGHFHQGKQINRYISLPSLACQKQIAIVQNAQINFINIK